MSVNKAGGAGFQPGVERVQAVEKIRPPKGEAAMARQKADYVPPDTNKHAETKDKNIPVTDEQLIKAIERSIKVLAGKKTSLDFSVHEKTKQIMVKVLDKETGEVIREIPPEKTLDFVARMWEMAGILIDEKR